jgi:hypothetical protein
MVCGSCTHPYHTGLTRFAGGHRILKIRYLFIYPFRFRLEPAHTICDPCFTHGNRFLKPLAHCPLDIHTSFTTE